MNRKTSDNMIWYNIHNTIKNQSIVSFFGPRLNTYTSGSFTSIFTQAKPNSVFGSIFQNNMDDSSLNVVNDSLIETSTLPRQAFGGYQADVSANPETACKVSF